MVINPGDVLAAWMIPRPQDEQMNNLLSLVLGLCIARFLQGLGAEIKIKWPNDLIHQEKKAGGILIEEKRGQLVAGIGLNLAGSPDPSGMREQSPVEPGHLGEPFRSCTSPELWAQLVYTAHIWYEDLLCNFSLIDFILEINSNLWLMGEKVRVLSSTETVEGVLMGIGQHGGIILETSTGRLELTQGSPGPC